MPIDDPIKYVAKIATKAGISQTTQNRAIKILEKAKEQKAVVGKAPIGMAASALYVASMMNPDEKKTTQKALAEAAGVTEVTIRNRYKGLTKNLGVDYLSDL